jgi:hypothetical protein
MREVSLLLPKLNPNYFGRPAHSRITILTELPALTLISIYLPFRYFSLALWLLDLW